MHCPLLVIIFVTSRLFSRGSLVEEITGDSRSQFSCNRPKIVRAFCSHQLDLCGRVITNIGWSHLHINVVQNNEIPMGTFWEDLHTFSKCVLCNFAYVKVFHVSCWRYTPLVTKVGPNTGYTDTIARQYKLWAIKYSMHKNCSKESLWILKRLVLSCRLMYGTQCFLKWYTFEKTGVSERV
jgi:hypothetical protein